MNFKVSSTYGLYENVLLNTVLGELTIDSNIYCGTNFELAFHNKKLIKIPQKYAAVYNPYISPNSY